MSRKTFIAIHTYKDDAAKRTIFENFKKLIILILIGWKDGIFQRPNALRHG